MSNQPAQPTVMVKKSDGTFVRMTLDEVKRMKSGGIASSPSAPRSDSRKRPAVPPPANLPMVEEVQLPAVSAPFAVYEHPKMPEPAKKPMTVKPTEILRSAQDDKKQIVSRVGNIKNDLPQPSKRNVELPGPAKGPSPTKVIAPLSRIPRADIVTLEELPEGDEETSVVPAPPMGQVDEIIKKLGFNIPADYANRLRSLIQLRLKDVRSEEQTKEAGIRPFNEGGLQLSKEQADMLVEACRTKKMVPVAGKGSLTPFRMTAGISDERQRPRTEVSDDNKDSSTALRSARNDRMMMTDKMMPAPKPVIRDVVAKPVNMGPVDEIKYFTLTDFRRLASNPEEASHRLRQKFIALKDESYLMYLDALRAWHESPLFANYMEAVHSAVMNKRGLGADSTDKTKIQMPEILAIINIEGDLI